MILILAVAVGFLVATGVFLMLQRTLTRIVLGITMCGNGINVLLLLSGGRSGAAPFADGTANGATFSDPMPQAMILTAIVINFGMVAFLLAMAYRSATLTGMDEVEDDLEDRRIAQTVREAEIVAEVEVEEEADEPEAPSSDAQLSDAGADGAVTTADDDAEGSS